MAIDLRDSTKDVRLRALALGDGLELHRGPGPVRGAVVRHPGRARRPADDADPGRRLRRVRDLADGQHDPGHARVGSARWTPP